MIDPYKRDGCIDLPDPRDYKAEERIGEGDFPDPYSTDIDLPTSTDLLSIYANDQGRSNACTAFALANVMGIELQKVLQGSPPVVSAPSLWQHQFMYPGTASETHGDYLQSALKSAQNQPTTVNTDQGHVAVQIETYEKISRSTVKFWLAHHRPIYTGVHLRKKRLHIYKVGKYGVLNQSDPPGGGHAVALVGYITVFNKEEDREYTYYMMLNSWGEDWGRGGICLIHEDDIRKLMTPYIITLK